MKLKAICFVAAVSALVGCSTSYKTPLTLNELPPAAQTTVRNQIGTLPIASITEEQRYGAITYRVETENKGRNGVLWVEPNGSIVKESRALVAEQRRVEEGAGAQPQMHSPRQTP